MYEDMKVLKLSIQLIGFCLLLLCCDNKEQLKEPIVSINVSNNGKVLTDEKFTITTQIKDNLSEVSYVDLYINNSYIETLFSNPFVFNLKYNDISIGKHDINVIFTLENGQKLTSSGSFVFDIAEGLFYQGGIIVEISDDGMSGLIVSSELLPGNGNRSGYIYGSKNRMYLANDEDYGLLNSNKLISGSEISPSANACLQYRGGGYSDWYMPAANELITASRFSYKLGITEETDSRLSTCWSSTEMERSYDHAYHVDLKNGERYWSNKNNIYSVVAVRRF